MSALKKTNLNSVTDLRTTVDANLATSLAALGYTESFALQDIKIGLGLITVAIAGGLYMADKKYGFDATYTLTIVSVVAYFLIQGVIWYLSSFGKYKNVKYIGYDDANNKITISSWTNKFDPIYNIKITVDGKVNETVKTSFEFMKIFDGLGFYKEEELTKILKKELEKINKKSI